MKTTKRRMNCCGCNKPIISGQRIRVVLEQRKRTNNIFRKAYSWGVESYVAFHRKCIPDNFIIGRNIVLIKDGRK